jgi:hypothetical protein
MKHSKSDKFLHLKYMFDFPKVEVVNDNNRYQSNDSKENHFGT